jgi:hypothetical protein
MQAESICIDSINELQTSLTHANLEGAKQKRENLNRPKQKQQTPFMELSCTATHHCNTETRSTYLYYTTNFAEPEVVKRAGTHTDKVPAGTATAARSQGVCPHLSSIARSASMRIPILLTFVRSSSLGLVFF